LQQPLSKVCRSSIDEQVTVASNTLVPGAYQPPRNDGKNQDHDAKREGANQRARIENITEQVHLV
jgi:hypothetical protein